MPDVIKTDSNSPRKKIRLSLMRAVDDAIEPIPISIGYRCGIMLTSAAMLLLPLTYLLLLFLLGYTIYWHIGYCQALSDTVAKTPLNFRAIQILGAFGLIPVVMLFLLKPLFYRDPKTVGTPQRLKESAEPFLFEYVAAICDSVGAPVPTSIRVNCDVNASASLRRGFSSLFSDDLTLTIGLPLAAGMTVRELTGILAHEFGHFAQTAGMRATFITNNINYWFWRAVYKRDRWDEMLIGASRGWDLRIVVFVYLARAGVWMSRQVLFVQAWLGSAISCLLLRQMEFDADRYEARMVGSGAFKRSTMRLQQLGMAGFMANQDMRRFHDERRLPDNLPKLIVSNIPRITSEIRKALRELQRQQKTGLFDTHPADSERIRNAELEETDGIWIAPIDVEDSPASILFDDFDRLCRLCTLEYYEANLGDDFDKRRLTSTDELVAERDSEIEARKALDRYFQVHLPIMQPLPLSDKAATKPSNPKETAEQVKESRATSLKSVTEYRALCHRLEKAESLMLRTGEALSCLECGLQIRPRDFNLPTSRRRELQDLHSRARDGIQHLSAGLLEFESTASLRLSNALQLLNVSAVSTRLTNAEAVCDNVQRLLPDALFISRLMAELNPMRILFRRVAALYGQIDRNRENRRLVEKFIDQMQKLHKRLAVVRQEMKDRDYPFNSSKMMLTLVQYALPIVPDEDDLISLVTVTQQLYERLAGLQIRLFAQLAHAAEQVETILGLPPLTQPDFNTKPDSEKGHKDSRVKRRV